MKVSETAKEQHVSSAGLLTCRQKFGTEEKALSFHIFKPSWSTFKASLFFTPVSVQVQILHRDPFFPLHT